MSYFICLRLVIVAIAICCLMLSNVTAQSTQSSKPIIVGGDSGIDGYNCDITKSDFDLIAHTAGEDKSIIAIARLGKGEASRQVVRNRLRNLRDFLYLTRGVPEERVILAEGERAQGLGQVEVYIAGKLFIIFRMKRNKDFFTGCQP
jgi:hypothetical protein